MKINFNKDFLFGSSFSGPQTEGANGKNLDSNWDWWYKNEKEVFFNEVGPSTLHNLTERVDEYVGLMVEQGITSVRTSIQWTRIYNDVLEEKFNDKGIEFYNYYFKKIKENNIKLSVCLFHFDMPRDLENIGGWMNEEVLNKYSRYAKKCFETFDKLVDYWITFNEPLVVADSSYVWGYHQPRINDFEKSMQSCINMVYANALAITELKKINSKAEVGMCLNLTPAYPNNPLKLEDIEAAKLEHIVTNNIFMYPILKGFFQEDFLNLMKSGEINLYLPENYKEMIKNNKATFLGVNYYAPVRVEGKNWKGKPKDRGHYFEQVRNKNAIFNEDRGWEIFGKGLYDIANWIKNDFGNIKWMVQENGMGVANEEKFISNGQVQDEYRINYYTEHLYWLEKAIREGSNCFGYHVWTFVDNWSWLNAFKNRYGLFRFDLETFQFTPKKSSKWYKNLIDSRELEIPDQTEEKIIQHVKKFE